jgi:ubiquinone/menaquinone biosynthesis C-methylase UbiE
LPFADASFDGAIFLNSLHHVPQPAMHRALREAARAGGPAGPIVVVEPLAEGSLILALRLVEDETEVRNAAQEGIRQALEDEQFEQLRRADYLRRERFEGIEVFLAHVVAVDPAQAATVEERRAAVVAAFGRHARVDEDGGMTLKRFAERVNPG